MRIRFTVDITRGDNHSPPWQWATIGALLPKVFPMLVDMFMPRKEPDIGPGAPRDNVTCIVDGHMFGGGLHCARCGARNATPS